MLIIEETIYSPNEENILLKYNSYVKRSTQLVSIKPPFLFISLPTHLLLLNIF